MTPLTTKQDNRLGNFQRKSLKPSNKDGKLWLILDKLKNAQATQSLKQEAMNKKEANKKYLESLDTQMKERNFLKQMQDQDVQMEKLEADQDVAAYGVEKEKMREDAKRKRESMLEMMKNSIKLEQQKKE